MIMPMISETLQLGPKAKAACRHMSEIIQDTLNRWPVRDCSDLKTKQKDRLEHARQLTQQSHKAVMDFVAKKKQMVVSCPPANRASKKVSDEVDEEMVLTDVPLRCTDDELALLEETFQPTDGAEISNGNGKQKTMETAVDKSYAHMPISDDVVQSILEGPSDVESEKSDDSDKIWRSGEQLAKESRMACLKEDMMEVDMDDGHVKSLMVVNISDTTVVDAGKENVYKKSLKAGDASAVKRTGSEVSEIKEMHRLKAFGEKWGETIELNMMNEKQTVCSASRVLQFFFLWSSKPLLIQNSIFPIF